MNANKEAVESCNLPTAPAGTATSLSTLLSDLRTGARIVLPLLAYGALAYVLFGIPD